MTRATSKAFSNYKVGDTVRFIGQGPVAFVGKIGVVRIIDGSFGVEFADCAYGHNLRGLLPQYRGGWFCGKSEIELFNAEPVACTGNGNMYCPTKMVELDGKPYSIEFLEGHI